MKKRKRNQSKTPKGERLSTKVSPRRDSPVVLKGKLLLYYAFIIKC